MLSLNWASNSKPFQNTYKSRVRLLVTIYFNILSNYLWLGLSPALFENEPVFLCSQKRLVPYFFYMSALGYSRVIIIRFFWKSSGKENVLNMICESEQKGSPAKISANILKTRECSMISFSVYVSISLFIFFFSLSLCIFLSYSFSPSLIFFLSSAITFCWFVFSVKTVVVLRTLFLLQSVVSFRVEYHYPGAPLCTSQLATTIA